MDVTDAMNIETPMESPNTNHSRTTAWHQIRVQLSFKDCGVCDKIVCIHPEHIDKYQDNLINSSIQYTEKHSQV